MRTRFFIIHNPNSGWIARHHYDATLAELHRAGARFEVVTTARHGEGQKSAAGAAASGCFHSVVAAGGDGTVHDVAQGLVGGTTPLGIIPMGTGNIFARELGLDFAPDMLAHTLLEGEIREIPMGQVDGQPFLFVVGVGFDA